MAGALVSPLISAPRVLDFLRNRAILGGSNMRLLPGGSTYHSCAEWAVPNGSVRGNPGFLSLALGGGSPPVRVSRKRSGRPETSDAKEGEELEPSRRPRKEVLLFQHEMPVSVHAQQMRRLNRLFEQISASSRGSSTSTGERVPPRPNRR